MDSVNTNTDIQNKPPNFGFNFNSSLGNMLNNGGTIDSLFAHLLSQNQTPPPAPPAPQPASSSNSPSSSSSQTQQTQQTQQTNDASYNNSSDNNGAANNANNVNSSQSTAKAGASVTTVKTKSDWSVAGKSAHHGVKKNAASNNADDNNSNTVTNNNLTQSPAPVNNQVAVNAAVTAPANTGNPQPTDNTDPTVDTVSNSNAPSNTVAADAATPSTTPASTDPTAPLTNADLLAALAPAPATATPTLPVSAPVTNTDPAASTDPTTAIAALLNAAIAANTNQTTTSTVAAPAAIATLVDPTIATNNISPGTGTGTNPADPTTPVASSNTPASELLALLMQLEQLAVTQANTTTLAANTDLTVASNGQTPTTPAPGADSQKIDLKSLLAAIAKLDSSTSADTSITDQNNGIALSNAVNLSPSSTSPAALLQNPAPPTTATAADTTNKLISTDFLNLFSLPGTNPNAPATLPVFNPGIAANTLLSGDGGASLDADAQGQNSTGARDGASSLLPDTNSVLPNTAPTQSANPYDFASQLSAMRATQGGATGLPNPIEQVVLQLSRAGLSKDGSSQMTIQLRPAELGRVDVKLNISSDGKVQGTVTADNPATLSLLLKDVRGLERALQEAGLRADSGSLQFGLRGDGQPGSGQTAGNQPGFDDAGTLSNATVLPAFANPVETYYLTPGGVNMRV